MPRKEVGDGLHAQTDRASHRNAKLLELGGYFVTGPRIVVVRPGEQHDAHLTADLVLRQHTARLIALDGTRAAARVRATRATP